MEVTTHMGGVDWNKEQKAKNTPNFGHHPHGWCGLKSLNDTERNEFERVTTHTGGVDWNRNMRYEETYSDMSPPTRVVWIEIWSFELYV